MTFEELGLSATLITALNKQAIKAPTSIQSETYQPICDGKDVIGCSETGSGKTLAYLLPLFTMIPPDAKTVQAVIVVPTQELGIQILRQIEQLSQHSGIALHAVQLIGEGNINRQIDSLKSKPQIIVGTCGRILKLLKLKKLSVHQVKTFIIDEADKMLAKDNIDGVLDLRKALLKYTQVLMFSASMDNKSIELAKKLNSNALIVRSKADSSIPSTIKHMFVITERRERIDTLRKVIPAVHADKGIIFANTAYDLEETTQKLQFHKMTAACIYGSNDKIDRMNAINGFKNGKIQYLISTDLASRGLQVEQIDAVFNLNLPEDSKEYLHRAGRCGRNGNTGVCISIITENELERVKAFQKEFKINMLQKKLYQGKLVAK